MLSSYSHCKKGYGDKTMSWRFSEEQKKVVANNFSITGLSIDNPVIEK